MTIGRKIRVIAPDQMGGEFLMSVKPGETYREMLGPAYARLIDVGAYCLRDTKGASLNIDLEVDKVGPRNVEIRRREVQSLLVDRCPPATRDMVVLALVGSSENERALAALIRMLEVEGFASAGFQDRRALEKALGSAFVRNRSRCTIFSDDQAFEEARGFVQHLLKRHGTVKRWGGQLCLGYAFRSEKVPSMRVLEKSQPWIISVPPQPLSEWLVEACGRTVSGAAYDFENYLGNGDEAKTRRKHIAAKCDKWVGRVRDLDGSSIDRGMTTFLWEWLSFRGSGRLSGPSVNQLAVQCAGLDTFRRAIGEALDEGDNPLVFKKVAEILETQMFWGEGTGTA